ncbi:hypothetical protein GV828_10975 [Flavobacterium sp. NST-5]|uniref:Uncharacterized protein n=1 Tax=Flavobacterium ichthyis TaxID=2698827 RepID=A0ABW9ZB25_9FLAO|nr:hypothetical protein [Flavobacterium ichthyis]NBL65722.1 hypothetical protein [Flavobacterium ichthyis]
MSQNFVALKINVQQVIDYIAIKDYDAAYSSFVLASEMLDEILDHTESDEDLIEISKYQVLLNQLHQKMNI